MIITSEGKQRVDRGDEVMIMRADEENVENGKHLDWLTEC